MASLWKQNHEKVTLSARKLIEFVFNMKERSNQLDMILKTTLHKVLESNEKTDEMSCFAVYFKDEGHDTAIY
jgi:hypothetical protein